MDTYVDSPDRNKAAMQVRKNKPADEVLATAERLNARLSALLSTVAELRDRVSGPCPPSDRGAAEAATQFSLGGFVGSAGQSLERAHSTLGDIETAVQQIGDVI